MTDLHCGRLDPHPQHHWSVPRNPGFADRKSWRCDGMPLIEGGWATWDLRQDEWEEREIREKREGAA